MPALLSTIDAFGPQIYYSKKFRLMIEDHLAIIRQMTTNQLYELGIDDHAKLNRYVGDFYGFLTSIGKERKYHWVILRMNGYRSRFDLDLSMTQLVLPDYAYIDKLAQLCKEKRK